LYHLSQFARATPHKLAVQFLESGEAFTLAQLERQAKRAANALLSLGLKQHDCVALCLENSPELLFLTLGATASSPCLQAWHAEVLVVADAIFHDGIFRGERRNILIFGELVDRHTVSAALVDYGAMRNDQPFVEQIIQVGAMLLHPSLLIRRHGAQEVRAWRNELAKIVFQR
jgi:hypothetical protein